MAVTLPHRSGVLDRQNHRSGAGRGPGAQLIQALGQDLALALEGVGVGRAKRTADACDLHPRMRWKRGRGVPPPPSSRAPSLCPAAVPLTLSASLNGICNRQ